MKTLILASGSPRRLDLLRQAGYDPVVRVADADESGIPYETGCPGDYVEALARLKNDAVFSSVVLPEDAVLVSADTVVVLPDSEDFPHPLGKPKSVEAAEAMIRALSGRRHEVVTGVMIRDTASGESVVFHEGTEVEFRPLSEAEIRAYCATPEPYDKAGGYGIQGLAGKFVRRISGDYCNVVGLPLCRVVEELIKMGV